MRKYDIHPDFKILSLVKLNYLNKFYISLLNNLISFSFNLTKPTEGLIVIKKTIKAYNNGLINIEIYKPKKTKPNAPCLVYYHGGAFILEPSSFHKKKTNQYALEAECIVVFVRYRLGITTPYPTSLEDAYAGLLWTYDNAKTLEIDTERIAVGGDSSGGTFAATVCQMAQDRNGPKICFQLLIYPCTDSTMSSPSMQLFDDTPVLDNKLGKKIIDYCLAGTNGNEPYIKGPLNRESSLANLPPAYIETAEFDPLRDEGILYAEKLKKYGVDVVLNQTKRTVHGYDFFSKNEISIASVSRRIAALNNCFNLPK